MLNKLIEKAKTIATPERVAAAKQVSAAAAAGAAALARQAQEQAAKALEAHQQKRQADKKNFDDLHPHVQKTLQNHANIQAAAATDSRLRGSALIDLSSAGSRQMLKEKTPTGSMTVGGVPLDDGDEQQHILLCGAPGTGKSVEIKKALRTIRQRGQRAVVYDPSGEFTSLFYRPDQDIILNPLDLRGAAWNPWSDAEFYEYAALAKSFIPDRGGDADPFWTESARAVFEALLMQCGSLDELVYLGLSAPIQQLAQTVNDAGFSGMIGPEKTFQSTRATLATYMRSLGLLENVRRDDDSAFSFRSWSESDSDRWVFLPSPSRARDTLRPLLSMFLDTAVRHIMGLKPDPERRIWLELDELPSLQNIPSLSPALAEGRKFGIGAILGVQTFHQLKKSFGDAQAQALWGLPKTRLYLRISDAETSEMISKELGESQLKRKTHSQSESNSYSDSKGGGNTESNSNNTSEQVVIERIVLPAEIAGLPDLRGYLRAGGSHRIAKVACDFDGLPRHGEQEDFIWKRQRALPTAAVLAAMDERKGAMETKSEGTMENAKIGEEDDLETKIRERAMQLMQESMEQWEDGAVATLTNEEINDLTAIFVERAELEILGGKA